MSDPITCCPDCAVTREDGAVLTFEPHLRIVARAMEELGYAEAGNPPATAMARALLGRLRTDGLHLTRPVGAMEVSPPPPAPTARRLAPPPLSPPPPGPTRRERREGRAGRWLWAIGERLAELIVPAATLLLLLVIIIGAVG